MICSFIIFSVAFAILRALFTRMYDRVKSEKPINWRKRFKRATRDEEDLNTKKDKLIDVELPKEESSPPSGEPKIPSSDEYNKLEESKEEVKEPSYLKKGAESFI